MSDPQKYILVVDDEPGLIAVIQYTLAKLGYTVITAANGAEALSIFKKNRDIELVITDVNMPLMDGITLIQEIVCIDPFVQYIVMTGLPSQKRVIQVRISGMVSAFLEKPFTLEQLQYAVEKVLNDPMSQFKENHYAYTAIA